jgi:endonuclease/exonuclease/phosphatase family metal-dependent hydrolase
MASFAGVFSIVPCAPMAPKGKLATSGLRVAQVFDLADSPTEGGPELTASIKQPITIGTPNSLGTISKTTHMRLVAWNLGHQTRERPIRAGFNSAVLHLAPDVLILNEYVHGDSREPLLRALAEVGLAHVMLSARKGENNQILMASKYSLQAGDLHSPTVSDADSSNFLHVRIESKSLEVVGVRVPAYPRREQNAAYWASLCKTAGSVIHRPIVYIGDLNADPAKKRSVGGRHMVELARQGWQIPSSDGPWSYISRTGSTSRIDHALVSPGLRITQIRYVVELPRILLAGPKPDAISDHAALVADVVRLQPTCASTS